MGATAALLFAYLATSVHAFCPQIDLASSSIRPGQAREWFGALRERVLGSVGRSVAQMHVHVGNWSHDLDQVLCCSGLIPFSLNFFLLCP
jgi:hypothetical protein